MSRIPKDFVILHTFSHSDDLPTICILPSWQKKGLSSKLFKYVVFWGSGDTNLQRLPSGKMELLKKLDKKWLSKKFRNSKRFWPNSEPVTTSGELKNCDRDLTRFPKGISLMTFQLSLFRGNQEFWGFVGKYGNIGGTRLAYREMMGKVSISCIFAFF